jgi:hypothetical protein
MGAPYSAKIQTVNQTLVVQKARILASHFLAGSVLLPHFNKSIYTVSSCFTRF